MTAEEMFNAFEEKYGDEFDWEVVDCSVGNRLTAELKKELGKAEVFNDCRVSAIARRYSQDDVLFRLDGAEGETFRIYHLTYSQHNIAGFPRYRKFADLPSVMEHIEREYIEDFLS